MISPRGIFEHDFLFWMYTAHKRPHWVVMHSGLIN